MKKIYYVIVIILLILLGSFIMFSKRDNKTLKSDILDNTSWHATDKSYAVFKDGKLTWYQYDGSENYYEGSYNAYVGADAKKYLVNDLKEYFVTEDELDKLFKRNNNYSLDNLIVVDINYNKFMYEGEAKDIVNPHVPWFGFILEDGKILDVANMNTKTYYKFKKD